MQNSDRKKILIVEDEAAVRKVLVDEFTADGFEVFEAPDGEAGLGRAFSEHPDIILSDIVMPKMDGLTMLHRLREDKWGGTVPLLLLSNFGETEKILAATRGGASGYLIKSNWQMSDVVKKVKDLLGMK